MRENYKLWNYKYDMAEINHHNYKKVIKQNFQLSITKIALLSTLTSLCLVMTIISKYVMIYFPIQVYTIEISFFTILIIYLCSNLVYSSIICIATTWFRSILGSEPIGLISMMITDVSFLIIFAIVFFLLKRYWLFKTKNPRNLTLLICVVAITSFISMITAGFIALICNDLFIFKLYGINETNWFLLWVGFGVTIAKFCINALIFISILRNLIILINQTRI